jgi:hypothetical protein
MLSKLGHENKSSVQPIIKKFAENIPTHKHTSREFKT